jgi:hypothetical protein
MKKVVLGSIALSFLLLLVILHLQLQPAGQARVLRGDRQLVVIESPVGWTQGWGMQSCLVPVEGGWLQFQERFAPTGPGGEKKEVDVDFRYRIPPSLPGGWPEGDWCRALSGAAAEEIQSWLASASGDELRAESEAAAALKEGLSRRGLEVERESVRLVQAQGPAEANPVSVDQDP